MKPAFRLLGAPQALHLFDNVEIDPVRDNGDFADVIEEADFGQAPEGCRDYWSVYLHFDPLRSAGRGVICVADVPTKEAAEALAAGLFAAVLDARLHHQGEDE